MADVAFAGPTALEVIRKVRLSDGLVLSPVKEIDTERFRSGRGAFRGTNFAQLGLSSAPTKKHPAWIRAPDAKSRKRGDPLHCLTFPKRLPPNALAQLKCTEPTTHDAANGKTPATPDKPEELFGDRRVFIDSVPLACLTIAAHYQKLVRKKKLDEGDAVVRLVELLMEFAGNYGRDPLDPIGGSVTENLAAITSIGEIRAFISSTSHALGVSLLKKALDYARDGSRSPMETCLWVMLTLPEEYGLFALGGAKLNAAIVPSRIQRSLMCHRTLTPDILWEGKGSAVEYQGLAEHASASARAEDNRRLNDYQICGVRAHFVIFDNIRTREGMDRLAMDIATSMSIHGFPDEERRIRHLLNDDDKAIMRARHLAHLLPPVRRE